MATRLAKKVLLIGWDAADWAMIRPLMAEGKMPALAALVERGASGNLATIQPALSPMLWNSIATGKRADKHGICGFVEPRPDGGGIRPVASTSRRCKAIWNILSQCGLRSNVISWFASHPAEPIRGAVVTDHFAAKVAEATDQRTFSAGTFHPSDLEKELAELLVRPADLDAESLLPFIPRAAAIDQGHDDRLIKLATILARASTVHAAACRLVARRDWDFTAVYYSAIDEFGHHFMPYHPPRMAGVSAQDAAIFSDVMASCYRFHDMMLEALLAYAGDDITALLVSDHGFHSGNRRPSADAWDHPEAWHREFGVAVAAGPGIRQGDGLYGATLLDVTPTILTLLGQPIGDDMDGRAWLEILDPPVTSERIESWESESGDAGMHPDEQREDPAAAAAAIQRLVDLGYLDAPSVDMAETLRKVARDRKINLAVATTTSRRAADALPLWRELAVEYPEEHGFQVQLASCCLRLGQLGECQRMIETLPPPLQASPFVRLMAASAALMEGASGEALAIARSVADAAPEEPSLLNRLGELFIKLKRWPDAEAAFRKSLEAVDDNPLAHEGLAKVLLERQQHEAALEHALLAVGLMHYFPAAHFHLGEALQSLGRDSEAIAAFETCLSMGYDCAETHRRLAKLYRLRNPAKSKRHEELSFAV